MNLSNWLTKLLMEAGFHDELAKVAANMSVWDWFVISIMLLTFAFLVLVNILCCVHNYIGERPARKLAKKLMREQAEMAERYIEAHQQILNASKQSQDRGKHL